MWESVSKQLLSKCFEVTTLKKRKPSDECVSKQSLSKCFTVTTWKRVANVIIVKVFQNSHCQSVSQ